MAPLRRRSRPPARFAAANRPRPGSGLSSIVPGKTIDELAKRAMFDVDELLAIEGWIIIAIERHDAKEWKNECDQYAWLNGQSDNLIKRFRELYIGEYEWKYKKRDLQVSLKHNNKVLRDDRRVGELMKSGDRYLVLSAETHDGNVPS
ncbi:hypothetical protein KC324_g15040 [Hortaea werneckii]|nr:hypothetical protein KC324_g15040 [Hortaea werneckii]